jgi:deoxyinosine 3'endonuclease (endonuclease V)
MKIKGHHKWHVTPKGAVEIQRKLQKRICISSFSGKVCLIAGADGSFSKQSGILLNANHLLLQLVFQLYLQTKMIQKPSVANKRKQKHQNFLF